MVSLLAGAVSAVLLMVTALTAAFYPSLMSVCLILYIVFLFGLAGSTGIQLNIETNWIGDLVAPSVRGWFTSLKWVISAVGGMALTVIFAQIVQRKSGFIAYAAIFLYMAITTVVAVWLMSTVIDRKPEPVVFFGKRKNSFDRMDYLNRSLWGYIWFFLAWSGGRTALYSFATAYMLDSLGLTMSRIAMVWILSGAVSIIMLFWMGSVSDRIGNRKPLCLISVMAALSMLLWVASAWWGLAAIIIYQVLNGAAGTTHSMLGINYGLEVLPQKGRAAYFAFARIVIGAGVILVTLAGGFIMQRLRFMEIALFGGVMNHYHFYFIGCSLFSLSCVIPLLLKRNK